MLSLMKDSVPSSRRVLMDTSTGHYSVHAEQQSRDKQTHTCCLLIFLYTGNDMLR